MQGDSSRHGATAAGGRKNCAVQSHVGVVAPAAVEVRRALTGRASAKLVAGACGNTVFDIPAMMFGAAGGSFGQKASGAAERLKYFDKETFIDGVARRHAKMIN